MIGRLALRKWIMQERSKYADVKYDEDGANRKRLQNAMRTEGLGGLWLSHIGGYLDRAQTFGLDTEKGRQAMGKAIVTMMHCLETAIEIHGPMPEPGKPSGEI